MSMTKVLNRIETAQLAPENGCGVHNARYRDAAETVRWHTTGVAPEVAVYDPCVLAASIS
jgi:hypothetical protein